MISVEVGSTLPPNHPLACCIEPARILTATFSNSNRLDRRLAFGHADKHDGTPVTPLDLLMQSIYIRQIHRANPEAWFLGEETLASKHGSGVQTGSIFKGDGYIIDPVDGTSNLGRDHANINSLVGFCRNNQFVGGMMCQPGVPSNGILVGHVDFGVCLLHSDARIRRNIYPPKTPAQNSKQTIYIRVPNYIEGANIEERLDAEREIKLYTDVKQLGKGFDSENEAAALRGLIMGKNHAVVLPPITGRSGRPMIWDVAAGLGIASSLGARITNWEGNPSTVETVNQGVVVSFADNPIHNHILDVFSSR